MKLAKISLAAAVALGALSTASFAQPLEEAIKGVDVSGYLRYRYDDDRFDEQPQYNSSGNYTGRKNSSTAKHKYRALANFKTPVVNNVAFNVGVLYINEEATTNKGGAGASSVDTGVGLGAGEDGDFGVNTYYATITPDSTKTTVMVGKMNLDTPITNAGDFDRGTGILALNSDIPNWTFAAGAFDTWAISDHVGYTKNMTSDASSVTESLYVAAAMAKYGDFSAQAWYFAVPDIVDSLYYLNAAYKTKVGDVGLGIKGEYLASKLATSSREYFTAPTFSQGELAEDNNLYKIEGEVAFKPVTFTLGYLGNSEDGYLVSFDDNAKIITTGTMGQIWWQNNATGVSIGAFKQLGMKPAKGDEDELKVIYATLGWDVTDSVNLALTYVDGEADYTTSVANGGGNFKREFREITPAVSYKHSKNLTLSAFYAMLETEMSGTNSFPGERNKDENRDRFRFEALYKF